jgi:hypothetical protein
MASLAQFLSDGWNVARWTSMIGRKDSSYEQHPHLSARISQMYPMVCITAVLRDAGDAPFMRWWVKVIFGTVNLAKLPHSG